MRKLARSQFTGKPKPPRSPAERAAERLETRGKKALIRRRWRERVQRRRRERAGKPAVSGVRVERVVGPRKHRQGVVVGNRADKTITVRIDIVSRHPMYKKVVRRSTTLHAHDERNEARLGDVVRVVECRPLSKTKRWLLDGIVERAR